MTLALRRARFFWRDFGRQRAALTSIYVLIAFVLIALLAPVLPIEPPMAMEAVPYQPPGAEYWMGTDNFGRDVFSRVIWGARLALQVAIVSAGLSTLLGIVLGSFAGYFGGWLDDLLSRTFDVFLLIPTFFLVILIVALFGNGIYLIMIAIAITTWPRSARIMRSQVLTLKSRAFVQATIAAGANHLQVLLFHIIPNGLAPVITNATILMGLAILTEAGLSFLGLGDPNTVSWGRMIFDAQRQLRLAPWLSIFPGISMLLMVGALNFIGDGINLALNPQLRSQGRQRRGPPPAVTQARDSTAPEAALRSETPLLEVRDLRVYYRLPYGWLRAVDGVSLTVAPGGSLGIVGESGSGKTTLGTALMGILPENAHIAGGTVAFGGQRIVGTGRADLKGVRWTRMAMVFQSAMNALNPVMTVGRQLSEAYLLHRPQANRREAQSRIDGLFDLVGIPRARAGSYPHELSGGMRQRVMIALALLLEPELIIADEPITALDVLVQDQILGEIDELRRRMNLTLIFISHDVATVAETCDRVAVMYAGELVEQGPTQEVLVNPRHPYTYALISALPKLRGPKRPLVSLPGEPYVPTSEPVGCRFAPRCAFATGRCRSEIPAKVQVAELHVSACHYATELDFEDALPEVGE